MEPIEAVAVPTHCVLVGLSMATSWGVADEAGQIRLGYVATNSTQRTSFVSLQAGSGAKVAALASRPSLFTDMPYGVVIELRLTAPLAEGETVWVALAQCGATQYYPSQPIDDRR